MFAVMAVTTMESNAAPRGLSIVFFSSQMERAILIAKIERI
jgi:hypothetical protein